jgi:hypothetical protein
MKIKSATLIWAFILVATPATAQADCSFETEAHLSMAVASYKEYITYSNEAGDTSDAMAKAEWDKFAHEMDWINDHGNMLECDDRKVNLEYYLYSARKDRRDTYLAKDDPSLLMVTLKVYYDDVASLYKYGYASVHAFEYSLLKRDVRGWFIKTHRPFKSWEKP